MAGTNCGIATRVTHASLGNCLAEKAPKVRPSSLSYEPTAPIKAAMNLGCIVAVGKSKLNILMINEAI